MKNYLNNQFDPEKRVEFFDEVPLWSAPFGLKLLDAVDYKPGMAALDIGFGTGFPMIELAMRLGKTSSVYGIDPWKEAVERARKRMAFYEVKNIILFEGVAEDIPLADNVLDLIVSNNGLNNVQDLEKVLSECSRVCKTNAQLVMTVNLDKTMYEFYDQLEIVLQEMGMKEAIQIMRQHIHEKRRPLKEIVFMLQKHDFFIREVKHDQFSYKFTDGTAMFNHYFIRMAFLPAWIKLIPEDKAEMVFGKLESALNEKAKMNGKLNLSIPFVLIDAVKKLEN
jgi:ubiquinone/menaquinone biosynthesis C-methylase UbiE